MYGSGSRGGLNDRFKKSQSLQPFSSSTPHSHTKSLDLSSSSTTTTTNPPLSPPPQTQTTQTQTGGSQSTWQPPDWSIEPIPGLYYLQVLKDGHTLDPIPLTKRRHIFGRHFHSCDFVLDHQSVSRQHAALVPHKNGSIFVIDLGSAHGTFLANERLAKHTFVEFELGQSLRFAASTRTYILRKNHSPPPPPPVLPPPPPDPSDEDAVVAYHTLLNRYCIADSALARDHAHSERPAKRMRRRKNGRVSFRDEVLGGDIVDVVGVSDGADVETEQIGPVGVKEGSSLVGKYQSLVQSTVIPKGMASANKNVQASVKEEEGNSSSVTDKLREVLDKVRSSNVVSSSKGGFYDELYGDSVSEKVGTSWASSVGGGGSSLLLAGSDGLEGKATATALSGTDNSGGGDDDDDLFGD